MQKQQTKVQEVIKPSLTGSWHGKDAFKLGYKLMLNILFVSLIYLILSLLLSFDSLVLRILSSVALVGAAAAYLYYSGMNAGQGDAAFSEIMYQRQVEGKEVTQADRERCSSPGEGFFCRAGGCDSICADCACVCIDDKTDYLFAGRSAELAHGLYPTKRHRRCAGVLPDAGWPYHSVHTPCGGTQHGDALYQRGGEAWRCAYAVGGTAFSALGAGSAVGLWLWLWGRD